MPSGLYAHLTSMADDPKREVNAVMRDAFRPGTRAHSTTREVLMDSPVFESRRPLLKQALRAQKRGEWYLVINALLPLVEGVLLDVTFPREEQPKQGRPTKAVARLRETRAPFWFWDRAAIEALETIVLSAGAGVALFAQYDPRDYGGPGEPRHLNRNAIFHGSARRYGTELNALKLYLLLVVMAECLDRIDTVALD
jgi:hypothetical protein